MSVSKQVDNQKQFGGEVEDVKLAFLFGKLCFVGNLRIDKRERFEDNSFIRSSHIQSVEWDWTDDLLVIETRNTIYHCREDFLNSVYDVYTGDEKLTAGELLGRIKNAGTNDGILSC